MMNVRKIGLSILVGSWILGSAFFTAQAMTQPKSIPSSPPAARSAPKMIWEYKDQLGLTEAQVTGIKDAIGAFQDNVVRLRAKLQVVELDIEDLVRKKADLAAIKSKLSESADLQVELRFADIETARKIDGVLTEDQVKKWREIQQKAASQPSSGMPHKAPAAH